MLVKNMQKKRKEKIENEIYSEKHRRIQSINCNFSVFMIIFLKTICVVYISFQMFNVFSVCINQITFSYHFMFGFEQLVTPISGDGNKRFKPVKYLGRGTFGFAELCQDTEDNNKLVCRKTTRRDYKTESEILFLYRSQHKNIIKLLGYYITTADEEMNERAKAEEDQPMKFEIGSEVYCLIIEFGENGDLDKYIKARKSIEEIILVKFIYQIIQAIQFLNFNKNMHRDIKAENILLNKFGNAKLADFGTVSQLEKNDSTKQYTGFQGSDYNAAPEIQTPHLYDGKYDFLVDIYSVGVVFYRACNSKKSDVEYRELAQTEKHPNIPDQYSYQFNDLIMSMLQISPANRANTLTILEKLNQIVTSAKLDKSQKKIFDDSIKLLYGIDGIFDKFEAKKNLEQLLHETNFECGEIAYELAKCYFYGFGTEKNIDQAILLLRIAARKQNAPAIRLLSFCYQYGIGVEKDLFTATQLLTIVQKNDPEANFLLGQLYYNSQNLDLNIKTIGEETKTAVKQDYQLAFHYLLQAKNFPPAQNYIGLCYLNGNGTEKNIFEAHKYFSLSAEAGYLDGMFNLAEFYLSHTQDDKRYVKKAIDLLTLAARRYHLGAAFRLSQLYSEGTIIPQDTQKASYYSRINSAGLNPLDPIYSYALLMLKGTDIEGRTNLEKNENEAISRLINISDQHPGAAYRIAQWYRDNLNNKEIHHELENPANEDEASEKPEKITADLFEQASNKGIIDATGNYAYCILKGIGRDSDPENAIKLLKESSELGSSYSTYLLAQCYLNGEGVEVDKAQALKYLQTAHSNGCINATYLLAHCLHNGEGVDEFTGGTLERSRKLYKIAAMRGHPQAAYELGMIFNQNGEIFAYKQKAGSLFEIAAKINHPQALTELGILYETGIGARQDIPKAFKLYEKAVNLDDSQGYYRLGLCYLNGINVQKDAQKGRELIEKAANRGIILAKTELGILYLNGIGGPLDEQKAVELFKEVEDKDIESKVQLAKYLLKDKKTQSKAVSLLVQTRKEKHTEGSYELGIIYMYGIGGQRKKVNEAYLIFKELVDDKKHVPSMFELGKYYVENKKNDEELKNGIKLIKKASDLGDPKAINYLGYCYYNGIGVKIDASKAADLFDKAISAGNSYAKINLGQCYLEGNGRIKNEERGFNLLLEAPQEDPATKCRLGVCYYKGVGVEKDVQKGISYLKEAAEQHDMNAMCYYGKMLMEGTIVQMDKDKAIEYFKESARMGQAEAKYQFGKIFKEGYGMIPKDENSAISLFRESSDKGFPKASYILGMHYFYKLNQKKEGVEFFEKASKFYHPESLRELVRIYREGDGVPVNENKAFDYEEMADDPEQYQNNKNLMQSTFGLEMEKKKKGKGRRDSKNTIKNPFKGYLAYFKTGGKKKGKTPK